MSDRTFVIEPCDPVIFRDGKPFTAGLSARTTPFPMPSAVIGAIRTRLGLHTDFGADVRKDLLDVEHIGPFLALPDGNDGWELAFPAPLDAVAFDVKGSDEIEIVPLRPHWPRQDEGTDLGGTLQLLTNPLLGERKPSSKAPPFWKTKFAVEWLAHGGTQLLRKKPEDIGVPALPRNRRMHVAIANDTQTAKNQMLFATEGLEFREGLAKRRDGRRTVAAERRAICSLVRYTGGQWSTPEAVAPLGGERRLAYWSEDKVSWPMPPAWKGPGLRLQLVTPAYFRGGWKPEWIGEDGVGSPPDLTSVRLGLVAAAVGRPVPISGWDFVTDAPKATRMLAPAGSVYFFEVLDGKPADLWMRPISDGDQERRDGFGLVICGGW